MEEERDLFMFLIDIFMVLAVLGISLGVLFMLFSPGVQFLGLGFSMNGDRAYRLIGLVDSAIVKEDFQRLYIDLPSSGVEPHSDFIYSGDPRFLDAPRVWLWPSINDQNDQDVTFYYRVEDD